MAKGAGMSTGQTAVTVEVVRSRVNTLVSLVDQIDAKYVTLKELQSRQSTALWSAEGPGATYAWDLGTAISSYATALDSVRAEIARLATSLSSTVAELGETDYAIQKSFEDLQSTLSSEPERFDPAPPQSSPDGPGDFGDVTTAPEVDQGERPEDEPTLPEQIEEPSLPDAEPGELLPPLLPDPSGPIAVPLPPKGP